MHSFTASTWADVQQAAITLLLLVIMALTFVVSDWIRARKKIDQERNLLRKTQDTVFTEVAALEQTQGSKLRDAQGKLKPQDANALLTLALTRVKSNLGDAALKLLDSVTGTRTVDAYLTSLIEHAVNNRVGFGRAFVQETEKPPAQTQ